MDAFPIVELDSDQVEVMEAAAAGGDELYALAEVSDAAASAMVEAGGAAGATTESVAEAGLEAAAIAADEVAAGTEVVPVVNVVVTTIAAALSLGALLVAVVGMVMKSVRCSITVTNKLDRKLTLGRIYIAHGKQTGTFVGSAIPGASAGNFSSGRLEFAKDTISLIGSLGVVTFKIEAKAREHVLWVGWQAGLDGTTCVALGLDVPDMTIEEFYEKNVAHGGPLSQVVSTTDTKVPIWVAAAITSEYSDGFATMQVVVSDEAPPS